MAFRCVWLVAVVLAVSHAVFAHPVPFSYLDAEMRLREIDVSLVVHVFDLAHELQITPSEHLFASGIGEEQATAIRSLLGPRLEVIADSHKLNPEWSAPEVLPERQSVRLRLRYRAAEAPGTLAVTASLFPYDPNHQTFVNLYESDTLMTQMILDRTHARLEYFPGTRQGRSALVRKFVVEGIRHILIGPDHILFLIGLLLLGGTLRRLALVVTSFTVAHSITLSLAVLNIITPPARLIEPAIALSIIYVGADNILVRGGRDVRAWIAFSFGFIHGFGFANVLREMDLPRQALGWSLFSFNLGVEIGQLAVVAVVAAALAALRTRSESAGRQVAFAGSVLVIVAGAFWFVQRVFFPGGIS